MIPDSYFAYPRRRPGTDHDRFPHRYLASCRPVRWPGNARIALWVTVHLEHFPMDMPSRPLLPLGGMVRPAPSVWDYTARDYGNRVGVYRIMRALDAVGVRASAAMNSAVADRYPTLLDEVLKRNWEIVASGVDMGHLHHGEVPLEEERALVERSLATLRRASGTPVVGWHSPAHSESLHTPDLVAAAGATYIADWINDDMPYAVATSAAPLLAMPLSYDLSDRKILLLHNQAVEEYERQILDAFEFLYQEAAQKGGRILSLSLAPWMIGQPHRIRTLERILDAIMARASVWPATGAEIAAAWRAVEKAG